MPYQCPTTLSYPEFWFSPQAVAFDGLCLGTVWRGIRLWAIFLHSLPAVMLRESTREWHLEMLVRKTGETIVYMLQLGDGLKHLPLLKVWFVFSFFSFFFFCPCTPITSCGAF